MITGKLIFIQFVEGPDLVANVVKSEIKYRSREAVRGNIYSSEGELMATSVPIFDLRMDVDNQNVSDKMFYNNIDSLAMGLAGILKNKSYGQYKQNLIDARENGNRYYLLKRDINYEQLKKIKKLPILRYGKYGGGLIAEPKNKRHLPFNELAKRTIGYVNLNDSIFVGLEGAFSEVLAGRDGKQLMRRINNGEWIPVHDEEEIEPENGNDIITTINIDIQDVAEDALARHLDEQGAHHGSVVLMEVNTGKIRAIANLKYDSATGTYHEVFNYAIGEAIEPGSTFKTISMLTLLEEFNINLQDEVDIGDGWTVYFDQTMQDVHKIGDGVITLREAFEKSSNVGISKIVYKYFSEQPEQFIERIYKTGLHNPLGIEIPGEQKPFIKHPGNREIWYGTSLPWMSIGYELKLTPLQILTFYNTIANNGKMVKPRFVESISSAGKTIRRFKTQIINESICSKKTIDTIQSLLEGVIERGTAKSLNRSVYKIAGKTGTSQIANRNLGYDKTNYNSSFVGYFPADDPQYSCIVVVNKPTKGKYYGSSVAAPVFQEIADKIYATHLEIPMKKIFVEQKTKYPLYQAGNTKELKNIIAEFTLPADTQNIESDWSVILPEGSSIKLASRFIKENKIPNVTGMSAKDAVYILEKMGLRTQINGKGTVRQQSISPGSDVIPGNKIVLKLSTI